MIIMDNSIINTINRVIANACCHMTSSIISRESNKTRIPLINFKLQIKELWIPYIINRSIISMICSI